MVLSDVHSNLSALEACLEAAPAHEVKVNLGDVVGYSANPNEVTECLRRECLLHVRGNHDKACSGVTGLETFNPLASLAAQWTRRELTPENSEWLRALPFGPLRMHEVSGVRFVHGSPANEDEYLINISDALSRLLHSHVSLTFFGHSHIQGGFSLSQEHGAEIHPSFEGGDAIVTSELKLDKKTKYLINPGSVGQPRDGDWRAAFALYDTDARTVTFYRVPYDLELTQRRILEAHLPEYLALRLAVGR